ncbi:hypothetical protein Pan14r_47070 [Crateriforma conspicua]|uniref:Uncharacterized protein n=2 Tax=Crateriforma conspicua TaxID=2527996 RepID=A0A5C5Y9N1_9PLAN|nr:hypothetical protein Pan14r_47070 [Crateriforma conspicua]
MINARSLNRCGRFGKSLDGIFRFPFLIASGNAKPRFTTRCLSLVVFCLFATDSPAEEVSPDLEAKIQTGFIELMDQADALEKRKHCLFVIGEVHETIAGNDLEIKPFYFIRIYQPRPRFEYLATVYAKSPEGFGSQDAQHWLQSAFCDGKMHRHQGSITRRYRGVVEDSREITGEPGDLSVVDAPSRLEPLKDLLGLPHTLLDHTKTPDPIEKCFFGYAKLSKTRQLVLGHIESTWTGRHPDAAFEIEVTHDAANRYFPKRLKCYQMDQEQSTSRSLIDWTKHGDLLLPRRGEMEGPIWRMRKQVDQRFYMKFHWLIGDQVPKQWTECGHPNYGHFVLDHFGRTYDRPNPNARPNFAGGVFWADPWTTPEDLFIEPDATTKTNR